MATWILYALVVSAAVAASAVAFDVAARALGAPRRMPWGVAILAIAVLPLLVPLAVRISADPASVPTDDAIALRLPAITIGASRASTGIPTNALILAVLVGTSALALCRFAVSHARLRREARSWVAGQVDGIPVQFSEWTGPAVTGWLRPSIVVPRWVARLEPGQRRAIMAHEMEHVRANDSLLLNVARLVLASVSWNPVAWLAYRRLQLAVELDCDRRVLAQGNDMSGYAETLLTVAQRIATPTPALRVALTEPSSFLSRRITTMLRKPPHSPRLVALGAVTAGALLLAVACVTREPLGTSSAQSVQQTPRMVIRADDSASVASQESVGERPFFEYEVERPVTALAGGTYPRYPESLKTAGIQGDVLAQFVVDAEGRPDTSTFKVLRASSEGRSGSETREFVLAVRMALPDMRFDPARKDGRPVKQVVQQPFMFQLAR
jgi:beta-lactamase regulating signal transducer with metallopeptidase domain